MRTNTNTTRSLDEVVRTPYMRPGVPRIGAQHVGYETLAGLVEDQLQSWQQAGQKIERSGGASNDAIMEQTAAMGRIYILLEAVRTKDLEALYALPVK